MEISKFGETDCSELFEEANCSHSTSCVSDSHQLKSLKTVYETSENVTETDDQEAERKIDEFIKSIMRMHNFPQNSSEINDLNENAEKSSSLSYEPNQKSSEFCVKNNKRKYSSDESVIDTVLNDGSILDYESSAFYTFEDNNYRKIDSTANECHTYKKNYKGTKVGTKTTQSPAKHRYPHIPPGVGRKETEYVSVIQEITSDLKYPCVGLDKITEIQGLDETHYYCEVCDFPCSIRSILIHLESFQHRLSSIKSFSPLVYKSFSKKAQYEIENEVNNIIRTLAQMIGCGKIKVEKEYLSSDSYSSRKKKHGESQHSQSINNSSVESCTPCDQNIFHRDYSSVKKLPSTSELDSSYNSHNLEEYQSNTSYQKMVYYNENTKSYITKYHCTVCNTFTDTIKVWKHHIRGKRHIINSKRRSWGFTP